MRSHRTLVALVVVLAQIGACRDPVGARAPGDPRRCGAIVVAEGPAVWTIARRRLRREGVIVRDPRPAAQPVSVAVMGGPHGALDRSVLPRARRIGERLARIAPQLTVVIGGFDAPPDVARAWFELVVPTTAPVLLVPGDRDDVTRYRALVATLATRHRAVLDGTRVRLFAARDVEVATLPGSVWRAPAGVAPCELVAGDPARLEAAIGPARAPRLLVTVTAPLQAGTAAIDRGVLGEHIGSRAVAALVASMAPRGVLALLPRESAGTLGDLTGALRLDADTGREPFALSVGTGGDEPFETLDGALMSGGAWIVRIAPARARVDRVE